MFDPHPLTPGDDIFIVWFAWVDTNGPCGVCKSNKDIECDHVCEWQIPAMYVPSMSKDISMDTFLDTHKAIAKLWNCPYNLQSLCRMDIAQKASYEKTNEMLNNAFVEMDNSKSTLFINQLQSTMDSNIISISNSNSNHNQNHHMITKKHKGE